jgi:hypothetical protein
VKNARGWVRVDGRPVADLPADLIAGRHWYVAGLDQRGNLALTTSYSGTGIDGGVVAGWNCADWTSADPASFAHVGIPCSEGSDFMESSQGNPCSGPVALTCAEIDVNAPLAAPTLPPGARLAFVSLAQVLGDTSDTAADAICQGEGGPSFIAMRSTQAGQPAISRFTLDAGLWYRPDGTQLIASFADFNPQFPKLLAPLIVHADGGRFPGPDVTGEFAWVWTGGSPTTFSTLDCARWTDAGMNLQAEIGDAVSAVEGFTTSNFYCNYLRHLYCFQR